MVLDSGSALLCRLETILHADVTVKALRSKFSFETDTNMHKPLSLNEWIEHEECQKYLTEDEGIKSLDGTESGILE